MSNMICITHALGVFVTCTVGVPSSLGTARAFMHYVRRNVIYVSGRRSGRNPASACIIGRVCRLVLRRHLNDSCDDRIDRLCCVNRGGTPPHALRTYLSPARTQAHVLQHGRIV
jgi:hypothetical protein